MNYSEKNKKRIMSKNKKRIAAGIIALALCCGMAPCIGGMGVRAYADSETVYTTDRLNFRTGPGTENEVLEVLEPGQALTVVSKVNEEWIKVQHNGVTGYVASLYTGSSAAASSGQAAASSGQAAAGPGGQTAAGPGGGPGTPDAGSNGQGAAANAANAGSAANAAASLASGTPVTLNSAWKFADFSVINSGAAVLYKSEAANRKNIVIGVNAGHGTKGGTNVKTWCHPDQTPKVTGGTTAAGNTKAVAVSTGMNFKDGTPESRVTLRMAQILKEKLLADGYDVLMIRDGDDVQLDNVARTVICNNMADCHIALHWDGDSLDYDKGCFYMSVADGIKYLEPVASNWQRHEALGEALIGGLKAQGVKIFSGGSMDMDLTQTSFSSVPSVDIELGNQCSDHSDAALYERAAGLLRGINAYYGF